MIEPTDDAMRVRKILREALASNRGGRRHPAEVTSDRLGDAITKWHDHFTPEERDFVAVIRHRLESIAELRDEQ